MAAIHGSSLGSVGWASQTTLAFCNVHDGPGRGREVGAVREETATNGSQQGRSRAARRGGGRQLLDGAGLLITEVLIEDPEVLSEASRWASGRAVTPANPQIAQGADMTPFVRVALAVGARVLASTADSSAVLELSGTVTQLAERAEVVSQGMITDAQRAASAAIETTLAATKRATEETAKVVDDASRTVTNEMTRTVEKGMRTVQSELDRLLGGDQAPVMESVKGVVARAMGDAQVAWQTTLSSTLLEVTRALDLSNEASPLRALERRLHDHQHLQHAEARWSA